LFGFGFGVGEGEEQIVGVEAAVGDVCGDDSGDGGGQFEAAIFAIFRLVLDLKSGRAGGAVAGADLDDGAGHGEHPGRTECTTPDRAPRLVSPSSPNAATTLSRSRRLLARPGVPVTDPLADCSPARCPSDVSAV
jgi:hypothetical protein